MEMKIGEKEYTIVDFGVEGDNRPKREHHVEKFEWKLTGSDEDTVVDATAVVRHFINFGKQGVLVKNTFKIEATKLGELLLHAMLKQPILITVQGRAATRFRKGGEGNSMRQIVQDFDGQIFTHGEKARGPAAMKPVTKERAIETLKAAKMSAEEIAALIADLTAKQSAAQGTQGGKPESESK